MKNIFASGGQVMLITVLILSGTVFATTAIAGLLMLNQIRQSNDIVNSNKAIFAADSGIEWRLYKFFKGDSQTCKECPDGGACPGPSFENGAVFQTTCDLQAAAGTSKVTIKSTGSSGNNSRAFEIVLE